MSNPWSGNWDSKCCVKKERKKVKSLSRVGLFATPWIVAYQVSLSMGFSRKARILEWVAISFSRRSSRLRDWTRLSCIVGRRFTVWDTRKVHWQVGINPWQGFCHRPYEVTVELQSRAPHLLRAAHVIHSHKHTVESVKNSRKHVH